MDRWSGKTPRSWLTDKSIRRWGREKRVSRYLIFMRFTTTVTLTTNDFHIMVVYILRPDHDAICNKFRIIANKSEVKSVSWIALKEIQDTDNVSCPQRWFFLIGCLGWQRRKGGQGKSATRDGGQFFIIFSLEMVFFQSGEGPFPIKNYIFFKFKIEIGLRLPSGLWQ